MFGKKKLIENAHIITDSDIQFVPVPRPCTVRGRKAVFHKWADKKTIVIKPHSPFMNIELNEHGKEEMRKRIQAGYIDGDLDVYTQQETVGIIEYEDGTVDEVAPRDIKFTGEGKWIADISLKAK